MSNKIEISLIGTHSTGKTTLAKTLEEYLKREYPLLKVERSKGSVAHELFKKDMRIGSAKTTSFDQSLISLLFVRNEFIEADIVINDRSYICGLGYNDVCKDNIRTEGDEFDRRIMLGRVISELVQEKKRSMNDRLILVYVPIEDEVPFESVSGHYPATQDFKFRDDVDCSIRSYLENTLPQQYLTVKGSVDERVAQIISNLVSNNNFHYFLKEDRR